MSAGPDPYRPPGAELDPDARLRLALELLDERGVPARTSRPPAWRLLWRLGLHVPPPPFLSRGALTLVNGLPFAGLWGAATGLLRRDAPIHWLALASISLTLGLVFGWFASAGVAREARRSRLPAWRDLGRGAGTDGTGPVAGRRRAGHPGS